MMDSFQLRKFNVEKNIIGTEAYFIDQDIQKGLSENEILEKAKTGAYHKKDISQLVKKVIDVVRDGKTFKQTVYVKEEEIQDTPVGAELTPTVSGMNVKRYSDKSLLIEGDTYVNKETLQNIKKEIGVGTWNNVLKGWIFPYKHLSTVLGYLYSDQANKGNEEKAKAIQNQKNAGLVDGDEINIQGMKGTVEENTSDSEGIKYNISLNDGTKLNNVNEKVLGKDEEKDDSKISEVISNTNAENRTQSEKMLYGIRPIENIHKYSLADYMKMHGLTQEDIDRIINSLKGDNKTAKSKSSTASSSKTYTEKTQTEGLTKKQLIAKLVYRHYQAVKNAIEAGEEISPEILSSYPFLKERYEQKRKEMSEETKRKISEALKKNKPEEITSEQAAKDFISSLSEEDINNLRDKFQEVKGEFTKEEQNILANLVLEKEKLQKEYYSLHEQAKQTDIYSKKDELQEQARSLSPKIKKLEKQIRSQNNVVQALSNGGDLMSFVDQTGTKHEKIPDFTRIDSRNIYYDIDTILTENRPSFIPEIDEKIFKDKGFILDAIRVNKDTYMVAMNGHSEGENLGFDYRTQKNQKSSFDKESQGYVVLTLDQLVLTNDYYITKQKANYKKEAEKKNQYQIDYWNKKDDKSKEYYYNQRNFYESMPVAIKKKVTKEQWNNLSLKEKEAIYIPVKKYNPEKLKSKIEEGYMWQSFHDMYNRFVDINAKRYNKSGRTFELGEVGVGNFGHKDAFASWNSFSEMLNWKLNDIKIQREEYSDMRKQALETSFGESNTNDSLLKKNGILVKRQNGEQIKPKEIEQLEQAWSGVQKSFGQLRENAQKDKLKISHSGNTFIYASKAAGMYIPSMKTIAVSNKFGEEQFGFTLGHEVAHWIDNTLGESIGRRYISDDYESTAGQIAIIFRKNLNGKTTSNYTNSTTECFARALEQYNAVETKGEDAQMAGKGKYFASRDYVNKDVYENKLKPLIQQFFEENQEFLKAF